VVRFIAFVMMCFVTLSLVAGNVAHAAEPVGCLDTDVAVDLGHATGDRDQVPSDDGKATPHHHGGCQGHQIGKPVSEGFSPQLRLRTTLPLIPQANGRVSAPTDPAYRPPRA
jgi:hypothetical protein